MSTLVATLLLVQFQNFYRFRYGVITCYVAATISALYVPCSCILWKPVFCYTASLDIILSWRAWRSLRVTQILRYLLKFAVAAFWLVVLPIAYSKSVLNPTGLVKFFSEWTGNWQNQSFYSYCVAIYLMPNILAVLIFFLPHLRRFLERSNWRIIVFMMWWAQASTKLLSLL